MAITVWGRIKSALKYVTTGKPQANAIGYDAGGHGRRARGWGASRLGSNTLLQNNQAELIARSRDAVRNSAIARSAIDRWQSNIAGKGIVPHFLHPDENIRLTIQEAWDKWVEQSDYNSQLSFYGQQSLLVRSVFEAGECLSRFHVSNDGTLKCQLIEAEQLPIFLNQFAEGQRIVSGIGFDDNDQRTFYRIYRGQPYDLMAMPAEATQFIDVPVAEMLHVFEPSRPGQQRGEPKLVSVLTTLHDLDDYADAERMRKKVSAMVAFWIKKTNLDDSILPAIDSDQPSPAGTETAELEPGSVNYLLPGEEVQAPPMLESGDYETFMRVELNKVAAAVGLSYHQLTGDLRQANYSSLRAGLLEFRRAAEQYQQNIIIFQFCNPVMKRWLRESVLSGHIDLPEGYFNDPTPYEKCVWVSPKWEWTDPSKEVDAAVTAIRAGLTSRTQVVRENGLDPEVIDNQQAEERKRAADLGITYDSDPNKVLIGRETQPLTPGNAEPDADSDQDANEDA
jgi:lambda family phage portal protein